MDWCLNIIGKTTMVLGGISSARQQANDPRLLVLLAHGSRRERFNLLANIVLHLRRAYRQSVQNGQGGAIPTQYLHG
jgi:hypothetical protein